MNNSLISVFFFKRFPQFLSVTLHPLIMPFLGIYIILNSGTHISFLPPEAKQIILIVTVAGTFALPLAFIPFFYYRRITTTFFIDKRQERFIPFVVTTLLYYMWFFLLHRMNVPSVIQAFALGSMASVLLTLVVTVKWKISAHMVGIGGVIGLVLTMSFFYHVNLLFYLFLVIFLAGLTGFARLSLNAHTPAQVYAGFGVGLFTTVITLFLF